MYANVSFHCKKCGRYERYELNHDPSVSVPYLMDVLEYPLCSTCDWEAYEAVEALDHELYVYRMEQTYGDDWKVIVEGQQEGEYEELVFDRCICGGYSCDGTCEWGTQSWREKKEAEYYYAHLAPNGESWVECCDPACHCHRNDDPQELEGKVEVAAWDSEEIPF